MQAIPRNPLPPRATPVVEPDLVEAALRELFGAAPPALRRQVEQAWAAMASTALSDAPRLRVLHACPTRPELPE